VTFEFEGWANNSWGLHDIDRDQISGTIMVYSDGSRSNKVTSKYFKHYFLGQGEHYAHTIYLRPTNSIYEVNDQTKSAVHRHCSCTWQDPVMPESTAPKCDSVAQSHLGNARRVGEGLVAGIHIIRYDGSTPNERREAAFAPDYNCNLFEELRTTYNTVGLPTSKHRFKVLSYSPGEPSHEYLYPPLGYALSEGSKY
jgi:hypothetical protein